MDEPESTAPTQPPPLSFEELRVLGCLIEKEYTTPDYYPLTLNALATACNQSTNRDPVVSFDDTTIINALERLKARNFVFQVTMAGARVQKYKHNIAGKFPRLEKAQIALLCTLMLRGPQTVGELRQRTERLQVFPDLQAIEEQLTLLIEYPEGPLVVCFPPGGGRRVASFAHLLGGDVATPEPVQIVAPASTEWIEPGWKEGIESQIAALRQELADLKAQLGA